MPGKDCDYFEDKSVMNFEKMVFIAMDKSNYNSPEVIKRVFFQVRRKLNPESNKCLNKRQLHLQVSADILKELQIRVILFSKNRNET